MDARDDLPRVIRAGRHVARTRRYIRNYAVEVEPDALVDEVRHQAGRGDGWVKIVGDWIDRDLGDLAPCWPADVLVEAIAAAHEAGARVTAHCFSEDSLPDLLAAGIDGIEHGTGFTAATTGRAAAQGVAVVPTLVNIATFPDLAAAGQERFPVWAAHMRALHARRLEHRPGPARGRRPAVRRHRRRRQPAPRAGRARGRRARRCRPAAGRRRRRRVVGRPPLAGAARARRGRPRGPARARRRPRRRARDPAPAPGGRPGRAAGRGTLGGCTRPPRPLSP